MQIMKILTENKGIADALKSWLGVVAIICAGAYSLVEYIEHKKAVKVERSLSYVEDYRGGDAADAKLSLNQVLADNQDALQQVLSDKYDNEETLNRAYNKLILKMTSKPSIQRNLEIVFSFFEEVTICVEKELCDKEVVQLFFNNDAKSLFNSFYPYVCSLRHQWKNDTVYLKLEHFYVQSSRDVCL